MQKSLSVSVREDPQVPLITALNRIDPIPEHGLFLGICSDTKPALMNLVEPTGPALVAGDRGTGKRKFLQVVACGMLARDVHWDESVDEWIVLSSDRSWDVPGLEGLRVVNVAEHDPAESLLRIFEGRPRPRVVLIDDFTDIVFSISQKALLTLTGILEHGHEKGITSISTLHTDSFIFEELLTRKDIPFTTKILTRFSNADQAVRYAGDEKVRDWATKLRPNMDLAFKENGKWVHFWRPSLGQTKAPLL